MTPMAEAVTTSHGIDVFKMPLDLAGYFGGDTRLPSKEPGKDVEVELKRLLLEREPS